MVRACHPQWYCSHLRLYRLMSNQPLTSCCRINTKLKALTLIYGPRTYVEHIVHQKDQRKMRRNKSALGKATIAYRQQKLSQSLNDQMCKALDDYEKNLQENVKCRCQFMTADLSMLLIVRIMLPQLHQLLCVKVLLTLIRTHIKV
jgi:hypothetical protein